VASRSNGIEGGDERIYKGKDRNWGRDDKREHRIDGESGSYHWYDPHVMSRTCKD
jgi:hypothetical protein